MVVDLDSTVVASVQQRALTSTSTGTTDVDTITSVTPGNTALFYNGLIRGGAVDINSVGYYQQLTNATTVTYTGNSAGSATSRIHMYTVVVFTGAALNGSVQRGTIVLSAQTSNTATITSVTTAKSFVNWGNFAASTTGSASVTQPTLTLTNATTVTAAVNAAGSPTVSYEVVQFN
jgi:hypothetical protein